MRVDVVMIAAVAATAMIMIPLADHAAHAVAELEAARSTLRGLRMAEAADAPGRDTDHARRGRAIRHLRAAAADHDVRLRISARPSNAGAGPLDQVEATGSQPAILAFVDAIETDRDAVRLRKWRIEPSRDGVRLTGEAVAVAGRWR